MTQVERRIVERGLRQLRYRVNEQLCIMQQMEARFPAAFCECLQEVLNRFEHRLDMEHISTEVDRTASSVAKKSSS